MKTMDQQNPNIRPGELLTLSKLVKKYGEIPTYIIIPKLQRDYAQGREGNKSLRSNFLKDLFHVIDSVSSAPRIYDYIYGKLEKPNQEHSDCYRFYPVDGQQRLTTMFLLHLYIGKKARQNVDFLKCFSYETRDSSKLFCEMLCDIDPKRFDNDIITYIKNDARFTSHWDNDPTISSMLRMLGDIDVYFQHKENPDFKKCWDNLVNNVQFWMLDLADLLTTDDIYIKMNSRGKKLTHFENFKAELDQLVMTMEKVFGEEDRRFEDGEFAMKIDTSWTDLFWDYRDKDKDFIAPDPENPATKDYTDNGLDDKMLHFFVNYLILEGLKNGSLITSKDGLRMAEQPIDLASHVANSSPDVFRNIASILDFFCVIMKKYEVSEWFAKFLTEISEEERVAETQNKKNEGKPEDVRINPNPLSGKTPIDYLKLMMGGDLTTQQKLFAEGIFYLIRNRPETLDKLTLDNPDIDNLRILRNLITNSEIHDRQIPRGMIGSMSNNLKAADLLMASGLHGLTAPTAQKGEFSGAQIDQEMDKCNWLTMETTTTNEKVTMKQLENHATLRGNLKQLYGVTSLSLVKMDNFLELFKKDAKYDDIEQITLSFGDYSIKNGAVRIYAPKYLTGWRDTVFVNSNNNSLAAFEAMLSGNAKTYKDYETHRDAFIKNAQTCNVYDWDYYLCAYNGMRWAPRGYYLLDGKRYLYYMFNASTCYHSDTYIHYNVYNYTLHTFFESPLTSADNHGGSLSLSYIGVNLDVEEDKIRLEISDGTSYHCDIPQDAEGFDTVDRVALAKSIITQLFTVAKEDENLQQPVNEEQLKNLRKITAADIEAMVWPEGWLKFVKDPAHESERTNDSEEGNPSNGAE